MIDGSNHTAGGFSTDAYAKGMVKRCHTIPFDAYWAQHEKPAVPKLGILPLVRNAGGTSPLADFLACSQLILILTSGEGTAVDDSIQLSTHLLVGVGIA